MDASLEEAAWVSGVSKARTLRHIVLPLLKPGMLAAALFFFVISIEIFDIVGLIGMPGDITVFVTWIYDVMHPSFGIPNFGFAGVMGVMLFAMSGVAIVFYIRFLRQPSASRCRRQKPAVRTPATGTLALARPRVLRALGIPRGRAAGHHPDLGRALPFLQPFSADAAGQLTFKHFIDALDFIGPPLKNTLIVWPARSC